MDVSSDMVNRLRNGEMKAYQEFVEQTWSKSVRACWIILGHQQDAEEAAQDAYVNLFRNRSQLRNTDRFDAWFYRVLMNSAKQIRRRRRPTGISFHDVDLVDVSEGLGKADLRMSVQHAMGQLTDEERTTLVLTYFCDLTDREAASATGWHLGTFKWRLAKAKRHMAQILGQEDWLTDIAAGGVSS